MQTTPTPASQLEWAPSACTLPSTERPLRVAEFDDLFASAVSAVDRVEPDRLRLELAPEPAVAATAAELVARETGCCSFFTFTLTATGGALSLDVGADATHRRVLDAIESRARQTVGRS